jgi:dipeptidyl aminopeptidase/acylaminoacyl peptidase
LASFALFARDTAELVLKHPTSNLFGWISLILKPAGRRKRFGFGAFNVKESTTMRGWKLTAGVVSLFLAACAVLQPVPLAELRGLSEGATARFLYPSAGGKAEAYLVRPRGSGPFPLIILLHGHSLSGAGARRVLPAAALFANELCYAGLAVSLPGYGDTEVSGGPTADATRRVVLDAVKIAKQLPWIDAKRLYVYGFSRGAVVAAALANHIEELKGALLHSGAYDLERLYRETTSPWLRQLLNPDGEANPALHNLLPRVASWRAPTLILHGQKDSLIPVSQARMLSEQLEKLGKPHRLVVFPERGHLFSMAEVKEPVFNFLKSNGGPACAATGP